MYVPPSSANRNAVTIFVVVAGFLALIGSSALLTFFAIKSLGPKHLHERKGAPLLLSRSDDGWGTYEFRDCGFRMEIPSAPSKEGSSLRSASKYRTDEAAKYVWNS